MRLDTYIFIDREKAAAYERSFFHVYGGKDPGSIKKENPSFQGKTVKDAILWASGKDCEIYSGTLCPNCQSEVLDESESYPLCFQCQDKKGG